MAKKLIRIAKTPTHCTIASMEVESCEWRVHSTHSNIDDAQDVASKIGADAEINDKKWMIFRYIPSDGSDEQIEAGFAALKAGRGYTLIREIPVKTPYRGEKFRALLVDAWMGGNQQSVRIECNDRRAFQMDADSSVERIHDAISIFMYGFNAGQINESRRRIGV